MWSRFEAGTIQNMKGPGREQADLVLVLNSEQAQIPYSGRRTPLEDELGRAISGDKEPGP